MTLNAITIEIAQAPPLILEVPQLKPLELSLPIGAGYSSPYTDTYEVTPSNEEQRLSTTGMMMLDDVVVHPIPSNYGLITWNGSTLTVS